MYAVYVNDNNYTQLNIHRALGFHVILSAAVLIEISYNVQLHNKVIFTFHSWGKFTVKHIHVKIVRAKYFRLLGQPTKKLILRSKIWCLTHQAVLYIRKFWWEKKASNLANHELFIKTFLANIPRYTENVFDICTDCSLFSSPIAFTCMIHQNFPPPNIFGVQYILQLCQYVQQSSRAFHICMQTHISAY